MARILLADDDKSSRDLVARALGSDGHAVDVTQDGSEALDKLKAGGGYDLLVTDVQMPGMDGVTLARHVQAAVPGLRMLLMSGYTSELDRASGTLGGNVGTIAKPFTLEQLRSAVKKALG